MFPLLTNPQVVEVGDNLLELYWNVDVDVLVETGLEWAKRRHWRKVVGAG
jgi:hypothetical protein